MQILADKINVFITENPNVLIGVFAAVTVLFLVILIVGSAKRKAQKKKLLSENKNLVELEFDATVTPPNPVVGGLTYTGYVLYSVNGQKPQIFGHTALVPAGEVVLDCEYFIQTIGKQFANSFGRATQSLTAMQGKKYMVSYDLMERHLELKEKK